jgi:hypothetical protein
LDGPSNAKDYWDKLDILGKFFSAVVLGLVTISLGAVYQSEEAADRNSRDEVARQDRSAETDRAAAQHAADEKNTHEQNEYSLKTQRLAAITSLIPLIRTGGADRQAALLLMQTYGDEGVRLQIANLYPNDPSFAAAASRDLSASATAPLSAVQLQQSGSGKSQGWIYLGEYRHQGAQAELWKTHYLEFDKTLDIAKIAGNVYRVPDTTGALYVRQSIPGSDGALGKPIGGIQTGQHVCVQAVREWQQSGFMWAYIGVSDGQAKCVKQQI